MTRIEPRKAPRPGVATSIALALALCSLLGLAEGLARADGLADEAELHFQMATEHYQRGNFRDALEHFLTSNRLVPNKNVVLNIARTFEQLRRFADAHRYYVDAREVEQDPKLVQSIDAAIQRIAPHVAVLFVETTPPGATIYIDRKDLGSRGRSPRPLALPEGHYRVIVELPGHELATSGEIDARLGAEVKVPLQLSRIVGKVRVAVTGASGAEVRVDDDKGPVACDAPCELDAPPGRHLLYFSREGYRATPWPVNVIEHQTVQVTAELRPLTGSLVVSTDERDALVEIDGRPMGFAPVVLQSVPVGRRRVRVRLRGFIPLSRDVEIKADGQTELTDLELTPIRQVDAASRYAESIDDAPSSVSIISQNEIRAFGYPTIAEALRGTRGVYLSNDRAYMSAGVRGLGEPNDYGNRLLVLSDGQSLNDNLLNSSYIGSDARVDLHDVDRIEIIRGPGSLLYGTGAFSGVINLVPTGRDEPTGVHASVGTYDDSVARARAGFHYNISPRASVEASVSAATSNGVDVPVTLRDPKGGAPVQIAHNVDFFRSGGTAGRAVIGPLTAQWFFHTREQHLPIGVFGTVFNDPRTEYTDTRMMAEVRYEPKLSEAIQLMTRVHANRYVFHSDLADAPRPAPPTVEDYYGTWFGGEARVLFKLPRALRLTLGGEAQLHPEATLLGSSPASPTAGTAAMRYLNAKKPYNFGAGYALIEANPRDWLRISAGSRVDIYSTFGPIFVPRAAVIVKPVAGGVLKVMGGRAFRAPSIYEQFYSDGRQQFASVDPARKLSLGPETIYSGEIEYSQRFKTDWVALGAAHVNYIQGIINTVPDELTAGGIHYANSALPALTAGVEVELRREFRRGILLGISYGYERAQFLDTADENPRLINAPEHLGSIRGLIPLVKDLVSLGARATLEAPRRISSTSAARTGSAVIADLTLSGGVKRFGLTYVFGLYNVTDARYAYPVTETYLSKTVAQNGRTLLADLTFTYP